MKSILAIALLAAGAAFAQDYPNKPIRVIVPYAAGGLPDTITRLIQPKMADSLGQQLVVENRGGAGGISGTEAVAKAAPDGYTLLVADVGQVAINPHIFSKLPYAAEGPGRRRPDREQRAVHHAAPVGAGEQLQGIHRAT